TNDMFFQLNQRVEGTVQEGFQNTGDPRVPVQNTGSNGADNVTPRFDQRKYPDQFTPMPMGTWQEARLIEAEALLRQGQTAPAILLINAVRAEGETVGVPLDLCNPDAMAELRMERTQQL